jgi:hypothetical protein
MKVKNNKSLSLFLAFRLSDYYGSEEQVGMQIKKIPNS